MTHAYVDTPAGQMYYETEGSGHPLILLHQSVFSSFEYEKVIPMFSRHYRVIAVDMPGFGRSDPPPVEWRMEDFARNVADVASALGIERFHLAGHHTGAVLAVEVAAAHPDRVSKLVLSGCAIYVRNEVWRQKTVAFRNSIEARTPMPFPFIEPYALQADGSHLMKIWNMQTKQNPHSSLEFVQKAFIANMLHWDKRGGCAVLAQMEYDRIPRLSLIKAPTLCLSGTMDVIGPPIFQPTDTAAKLIPGAEHKWIEGGGLGVAYEMPGEWAQPILEFLKDQHAA